MGLEAVLMDSISSIVIDRHWQEVILDIWPFELIRRTDKAPASNWLLAPMPLPRNNHSAPIMGWLYHFNAGYKLTGFALIL